MDENQTTTPDTPQLSIADLQNVRAVIDMAVRRGAFSAAEATSVGQVFDRVNNFLNAVAPQEPATADEAQAGETE